MYDNTIKSRDWNGERANENKVEHLWEETKNYVGGRFPSDEYNTISSWFQNDFIFLEGEKYLDWWIMSTRGPRVNGPLRRLNISIKMSSFFKIPN